MIELLNSTGLGVDLILLCVVALCCLWGRGDE